MLYCVGIGLAFVVVGHALGRVLHFARRPTRWAWVIAMVGSYLVPVAAWIRPDAFATFAAPIPHVIQSPTGSATGTTSTLLQQPGSRPFSLSDLDLPMRRLRLAVEMDCDARVLGRGHPEPDYGELLLQVGHRRARLPLGAPAFGEPASFLERRIRRMAAALPRWRWLGAAVAGAVAAGAIIGACEAPRPVSPEQAADRAAGASRTPE